MKWKLVVHSHLCACNFLFTYIYMYLYLCIYIFIHTYNVCLLRYTFTIFTRVISARLGKFFYTIVLPERIFFHSSISIYLLLFLYLTYFFFLFSPSCVRCKGTLKCDTREAKAADKIFFVFLLLTSYKNGDGVVWWAHPIVDRSFLFFFSLSPHIVVIPTCISIHTYLWVSRCCGPKWNKNNRNITLG